MCIFGAGGVGGYFHRRIAETFNGNDAKRFEIYFITRGKHLDVIKREGIAVKTPERTIAAFGIVSAYIGKTLGAIMENGDQKGLVRGIMEEIFSISKKKSIGLPQGIIEKSMKKAYNFPYEARTSYQRDIESNNRFNEGDLFGGTIIREGIANGFPTPITAFLYKRIIDSE